MAHHCMLDRVLDRIKMSIDIEKFDNTEMKDIKDNGKIYSQLFLGEALFFNKTRGKKEVESVLIMKSSASLG